MTEAWGRPYIVPGFKAEIASLGNMTDMDRGQRSGSAALPTQEKTQTAADGRLAREHFKLGVDFVAPSNDLELQLAAIWQEILSVERIGSLDDFFELGGDSLMATELFTQLDHWFGVRLTPDTILDHPTVASLAAFLAGEAKLYAGRCLVPMQAAGAVPPLFFIHPLGGDLIGYRHLLRRLGARRQIYGLRYPGQDRAPTTVLSIPEMAATYVAAVRKVQPQGPYFLVGWSLGGPIAYEMASQLSAAGDETRLLAIIDAAARDGKMRGLQQVARKLARHLSLLSEEAPARWSGYLLGVLRREFNRLQTRRARRQPNDRPLNLGDLLYAQYQSYTPPPYKGPIKLLRCTHGLSYWNQRNLGWDKYAAGPIESFDMPADHLTVMAEPVVALVVAYLDEWLKEAEEMPSPR